MKLPQERKYLYIGSAIALVLVLFSLYKIVSKTDGDAQMLVLERKPYEQQISVSGTVQAAQEVDLGFAQSGRISRTYGAVGERVRAGAVIAEIDNGDLYAALSQKKAALDTAEAELASLKAGTRSEKIAVAQAQVESDTVTLAQAKTALVDAIENAYTHADDAVHNKIDQFFSNPRSYSPVLDFNTSDSQLDLKLRSTRVAAERMLTLWQSQVDALSVSDDILQAADKAKENLMTVSAFLVDANTALNTVIYNASVSASDVSGYITSVSTARTNINTATASLTSAITAVRSAQTQLEKDKKTLALEEAGATPEDIDAQAARVSAARADLDSARAQLNKTLVLAPFAGTITRMDASVGEVVSPSVPEISMISDGLFEIETFIPEVQIQGLQVGNPASIALDAYGSGVVFEARVIAIDPAETVKNGVSTYKTTLQFLSQDARIRSGMTASVTITTMATDGALAIPLGAVYTSDDGKVVQVMRDGRKQEVRVEISDPTLGNVQVFSGLQEGDKVILNPDMSR